MNTITRVREIGALIVYRRGDWCLAERLPRYVVGRNVPDGQQCMLEEFRQKRSALKWAEANSQG